MRAGKSAMLISASCGGVSGWIFSMRLGNLSETQKATKKSGKLVKFLYRCEEISIYPNREEKVSLERNRN